MTSRRLVGVGAGAIVLLALLAGCGLLPSPPSPSPHLAVSPSALDPTTSSATVMVSNDGATNTVLEFQASAGDAAVQVSPSSGSVAQGTSTALTVTVDGTQVAPSVNLSTSVSVTSNGGNATIPLSYGIGTCGAFTPQAIAPAGLGSAGDPASAAAPAGAHDPADLVPHQIIVGYTAPSGLATAALRTQALSEASVAVRRAYGLALLAGGAGQGPDLVSATDVPATLAKLRADPRVRYAQANRRVHLLSVPNDPYYAANPSSVAPNGEWNLRDFGLEQAWNVETGTTSGQPVVIAIVDSGVQSDHPDFGGAGNSRVLPGYDFYNDTASGEPGAPGPGGYSADQIHGTHVAGIAAAVGNNGQGIAGVAYGPDVQILPVKVFDDSGSNATVMDVVNGVRWAAGLSVAGVPANPHPADIINLSLGVAGDEPALDAAAQDAWNAGSLLIAAAGNHDSANGQPDTGVASPANAPCVMAVGSVDDPRTLSYFSNTGPQLELVAPGGFFNPAIGTNAASNLIVSTIPDSTYGFDAGTSMAAPFVAGVAALLEAHDPGLTPAQLRRRLDASTLRTTGAGGSVDMSDRARYGYGLLCADTALGVTATTCGP